jgi:hypothetical protein
MVTTRRGHQKSNKEKEDLQGDKASAAAYDKSTTGSNGSLPDKSVENGTGSGNNDDLIATNGENNNSNCNSSYQQKVSSQVVQDTTGGEQHDDSTAFVETPILTTVSLLLIALVSYFTYPDSLQPIGRPTLNHVWYFGWISALSTGLGVLPLIFSPSLDTWWVGVTNGK